MYMAVTYSDWGEYSMHPLNNTGVKREQETVNDAAEVT